MWLCEVSDRDAGTAQYSDWQRVVLDGAAVCCCQWGNEKRVRYRSARVAVLRRREEDAERRREEREGEQGVLDVHERVCVGELSRGPNAADGGLHERHREGDDREWECGGSVTRRCALSRLFCDPRESGVCVAVERGGELAVEGRRFHSQGDQAERAGEEHLVVALLTNTTWIYDATVRN